MEPLLGAIETTAVAQYLRAARWGYAAVNATHIFGLALLVGAIVPLDLRLLGCWRSVPRATLVRVLVPVAAGGLGLAIATGLLLFSIRAREYAALEIFQIKLALVSIGVASALTLHLAGGKDLATVGSKRAAVHAIISLVCWTGALACGRVIAFAAD